MDEHDVLLQALDALIAAAKYLSAVDVSQTHLMDEEDAAYSPLTIKVIEAVESLRPLVMKPENTGLVALVVKKYECVICADQFSAVGEPQKCPACGYKPVIGTFPIIDQGEQL